MKTIGLGSPWLWIAQLPSSRTATTAEEAALVFSGPRFFIALIAGVLLAFALQFVLTNLSVAAGISYLGRSHNGDSDHEANNLGGTIRKVGFAVGLWTLITVSIALFIACLLAVKLSLLDSAGLGAIVGLVIWAAYFSLLVWFSSNTVSSLLGSVINTATSGFQAIVGTAAAAFGAKAVNDRVVATAEAAASAVRRELTSGLDAASIRDNIEDYIDRLTPPELDLSRIRSEFETLLSDPELKRLAATGELQNLDRQRFVDLVSSRTDFSKREVNRIADQLQSVWNQVVGQQKDPITDFRNYLASARPEELRSDELSRKLDVLIDEMRQSRRQQTAQTEKTPNLLQQALQYGLSTLSGTVLGRADLSNLDVERIVGQLQSAGHRLLDQASNLTDQPLATRPFNPIRADVENYLLNSYPWHLNRETLNQEFRDVIYDLEADPNAVRSQLEQLNRRYFVDLLVQRGAFSEARINEIADQLEAIRTEVLTSVTTAAAQQGALDLYSRVEHYILATPKSELTPEQVTRDFRAILEDPQDGYEALQQRLSQFDRNTLVQLIKRRSDLHPEEAALLLTQLEQTRDQVLSDGQSNLSQIQSQAATLQQRVENYLRNTGKSELNPEGIKRDFQRLLEDPQTGLHYLRARAAQFDRDTLVQLLSQRQDISSEEADRILDQVEEIWHRVVHAPQALTGQAREQYDRILSAIAGYLQNTRRPELDPEGIRQDLITLLHDPKQGALAVRRRLAQIDRQTLVQLLAQRPDLTEAQANRLLDQVQEAIQQIVRTPRRLAFRTQQRIYDFQSNLENYLRSTHKEELNPEGIKRDFQLLLQDPRAGMGSLRERLSHVDRATIVALLSQRQDMTEEEANRVVDQVLAARNQVMEQIQSVQRRIQSVIDSIFARIRAYLNSLDRPELNYDGIKRDLRTLLQDPQAGFESLRDRLSHVNRDTLVAILSSREDISEADANRLIDQIEGARNSVLQRAERLQQETQRRMAEVKYQAQRQAEETRKAAETAAWWLFWTAIASGGSAALAGALAVAG